MKKKKKWVMPTWMKKYRFYFNNTGGNTIEELMNNKDATVFDNAPLAMICVVVKSQVELLTQLYGKGLLDQSY